MSDMDDNTRTLTTTAVVAKSAVVGIFLLCVAGVTCEALPKRAGAPEGRTDQQAYEAGVSVGKSHGLAACLDHLEEMKPEAPDE